MKENLGIQISPILEEIEMALLEHQIAAQDILTFTDNGFRAAIKIFMDATLSKMWVMQENENLAMEDKCNMAEKLGEELRKLIKVYTNIETHELYKN